MKTELNTKPDEVAGILHDDESDDSDEDELPSIKNPIGVLKDVGNGNEWRETNR